MTVFSLRRQRTFHQGRKSSSADRVVPAERVKSARANSVSSRAQNSFYAEGIESAKTKSILSRSQKLSLVDNDVSTESEKSAKAIPLLVVLSLREQRAYHQGHKN